MAICEFVYHIMIIIIGFTVNSSEEENRNIVIGLLDLFVPIQFISHQYFVRDGQVVIVGAMHH